MILTHTLNPNQKDQEVTRKLPELTRGTYLRLPGH